MIWNAAAAAWSIVGAIRDRKKIWTFIKDYYFWIMSLVVIVALITWWLP